MKSKKGKKRKHAIKSIVSYRSVRGQTERLLKLLIGQQRINIEQLQLERLGDVVHHVLQRHRHVVRLALLQLRFRDGKLDVQRFYALELGGDLFVART